MGRAFLLGRQYNPEWMLGASANFGRVSGKSFSETARSCKKVNDFDVRHVMV
jgi:hypothetical protein